MILESQEFVEIIIAAALGRAIALLFRQPGLSTCKLNDATGFLPASSGQGPTGHELLLQVDAGAVVDRRHAERF
jgi:hypothetical protein